MPRVDLLASVTLTRRGEKKRAERTRAAVNVDVLTLTLTSLDPVRCDMRDQYEKGPALYPESLGPRLTYPSEARRRLHCSCTLHAGQ